jgi:hypothetical protein
MKPRTYRGLCFLEIMLVVVFFFVLTVQGQDYALPEFRKYMQHPSPQTLQAFYDKKQEEVRLREKIAAPIGIVAVALAIPIFRNRRSRTNSQS